MIDILSVCFVKKQIDNCYYITGPIMTATGHQMNQSEIRFTLLAIAIFLLIGSEKN